MQLSDKDLLEGICKKSETAFNDLYKRYKSLFYNLAYSYTNDKELSVDIMQNFWMSIWSKPEAIKTDTDNSAKAFLYKHFSFCVSNYYRSLSIRQKGMSDEIDLIEDEATYTHIMEEIQVKDLIELIDQAIDEMPQIARRIFIHRWKEDYTQKETAQSLSVTEQTVRNQYNWGISFVRKRLISSHQLDLLLPLLSFLTTFL